MPPGSTTTAPGGYACSLSGRVLALADVEDAGDDRVDPVLVVPCGGSLAPADALTRIVTAGLAGPPTTIASRTQAGTPRTAGSRRPGADSPEDGLARLVVVVVIAGEPPYSVTHGRHVASTMFPLRARHCALGHPGRPREKELAEVRELAGVEYPQAPVPSFLFDLDGTLIDSVYQHVIAWRAGSRDIGIDLSAAIHRRIG